MRLKLYILTHVFQFVHSDGGIDNNEQQTAASNETSAGNPVIASPLQQTV